MAARQAKIVTVFNEKGGAGKTTLSCQLANALARRGLAVLIADLDDQMAATAWSANAETDEDFRATVWGGAAYGNRVIQEIAKFRDKYDVIIADCAPGAGQPSTWAMLLVCDAALIPSMLAPLDLMSIKAAKRLARRAWEEAELAGAKRRFPVRVVATRARMHRAEDQHYHSLLLKDAEIPILEEKFGDRVAYQRSVLSGTSVHAVPGSKDAVAEVEAVTDYVADLLGLDLDSKGASA